jgi:hypothetical protein
MSGVNPCIRSGRHDGTSLTYPKACAMPTALSRVLLMVWAWKWLVNWRPPGPTS